MWGGLRFVELNLIHIITMHKYNSDLKNLLNSLKQKKKEPVHVFPLCNSLSLSASIRLHVHQ